MPRIARPLVLLLALLCVPLARAQDEPVAADADVVEMAPAAVVETAPPAVGQVQPPDLAARIAAAVEPLADDLRRLEDEVADPDRTEDELERLRPLLRALADRALERVLPFQDEIRALDGAVSALPPPAEGVSEPADVTERRQALVAGRLAASQALRGAEAVSARAHELDARVAALRRERFFGALGRRRDLSGQVLEQTLEAAPRTARRIALSVRDWIANLVRYHPGRLATALLAALGAGLLAHLLLRPVRRWRDRLVERSRRRGEPVPALQRLTFAFAATCLTGLVLALTALALDAAMTWQALYRLRIDEAVRALLTAVVGVSFVWVLLAAVLAPRAPDRRIVALPDRAARRLFLLGGLVAVVYGADLFLSQLFAIYAVPVALSVVKSLFAALLIAGLMVAIVMTRLRPGASRHGWNLWLAVLVWGGAFVIVGAAVSGYVAFARFVAGQFVVTGSILGTMYLGHLVARAISRDRALRATSLGRRLVGRGATDERVEQVALALSLVLNALVLLVGLPFLLLQWGSSWTEIGGWVRRGFEGFEVAGFEFSFTRLLIALGLFVLIYQATRALQRWFDGSVATRTRMDAGVRNSVRSGIGYVGVIIAILVALSAAGLNLSNLAIIVGALSVGIGFGLQNIVNNFVSGIIMLVERPIKVGDYVAVSGREGTVRKISVRATELETLDRQSVIVPNADFIGSPVANWMHVDRVRRLVMPIGVAYGSDTELVRDILKGVLMADERVARLPEPFVYFADFGASSLDFQLRFFIDDISNTQFVESDIRFAIDRAFRENGIEIPFGQTDLHLRSISTEAAQALRGGDAWNLQGEG